MNVNRRLPAFSDGRRNLRETNIAVIFISYFRKVTKVFSRMFCFFRYAPKHSTSTMHVSVLRQNDLVHVYKYLVMMLLIMFMYEFRSDHRNYNNVYMYAYHALLASLTGSLSRTIRIHIHFYCYYY